MHGYVICRKKRTIPPGSPNLPTVPSSPFTPISPLSPYMLCTHRNSIYIPASTNLQRFGSKSGLCLFFHLTLSPGLPCLPSIPFSPLVPFSPGVPYKTTHWHSSSYIRSINVLLDTISYTLAVLASYSYHMYSVFHTHQHFSSYYTYDICALVSRHIA